MAAISLSVSGQPPEPHAQVQVLGVCKKIKVGFFPVPRPVTSWYARRTLPSDRCEIPTRRPRSRASPMISWLDTHRLASRDAAAPRAVPPSSNGRWPLRPAEKLWRRTLVRPSLMGTPLPDRTRELDAQTRTPGIPNEISPGSTPRSVSCDAAVVPTAPPSSSWAMKGCSRRTPLSARLASLTCRPRPRTSQMRSMLVTRKSDLCEAAALPAAPRSFSGSRAIGAGGKQIEGPYSAVPTTSRMAARRFVACHAAARHAALSSPGRRWALGQADRRHNVLASDVMEEIDWILFISRLGSLHRNSLNLLLWPAMAGFLRLRDCVCLRLRPA